MGLRNSNHTKLSFQDSQTVATRKRNRFFHVVSSQEVCADEKTLTSVDVVRGFLFCTETLVQHLAASTSPLLSSSPPKTSPRLFPVVRESSFRCVTFLGVLALGFHHRLLITNLLEKCLTGNFGTLEMVPVPSGHLLDLFLTL